MINSYSEAQSRSLSVIMPIYNEASSLADVLLSVSAYCRKRNFDLILVDDGSTDSTHDILTAYREKPGVKVLRHKLNRGYGGAIKSGIQAATTPYVVTIDADGQHQVDDVEKLFVFAIERDVDLVVGNRGGPTSGWYREMGKGLIRNFTRFLVPLPIYDLNSGFKLYRTDLAKRYIHLCPDTMAFSDVIALVFINQRHLVLECPITVRGRRSGRSTIGVHTAFDTIMEILNIVMLFNPLRVFLPLSLLGIVVGLGWGIPFILMGRGVSVGSMLAIVIGLIFFVIGLVAHQLSALRIGLIESRANQAPAESEERERGS